MTDPVAIMVSHLEHKARCLESHALGSAVRIEHQRVGAASLFRCTTWPHDIGFNRAYGVDAADYLAVRTIASAFAQHGLRPLLEISP